jgi:ATP-dependent Zn protease
MTERYPHGTAYHEAGHAVVAWSLGVPVKAISVSADDASGGAEIGSAEHLLLMEQVAICSAGMAAAEVFGHSTHELAASCDRKRIMDLIKAHGVSEEARGPALRYEAYSFARDRLEAHRGKVVTLAELLVQRGRIEAAEVRLLLQQRP